MQCDQVDTFDTELLIKSVEERPCLYKKDFPRFYDRQLKQSLWDEIYEKLVPDWSALPHLAKEAKSREIQKKWRCIRISFSRDMRERKLNPRRSKYRFSDLLMFLIPEDQKTCRIVASEDVNTMADDDAEGNDYFIDGAIDLIEEEIEPVGASPTLPVPPLHYPLLKEEQHEHHDPKEKQSSAVSTETKRATIAEPHRRKRGKSRRCSTNETMQDNTTRRSKKKKRTKNDDDTDECKNFLMSLLPSFKYFDDDQRYMAKIEILNVMRHIKATHNVSPLPRGHWPPFTGGFARPPSSRPGTSKRDPLENLYPDATKRRRRSVTSSEEDWSGNSSDKSFDDSAD